MRLPIGIAAGILLGAADLVLIIICFLYDALNPLAGVLVGAMLVGFASGSASECAGLYSRLRIRSRSR